MRILIFDTETEARVKNHEFALRSGSGHYPEQQTIYRFNMIKSTDDKFALEISDEELLNESESGNLVERDETWNVESN